MRFALFALGLLLAAASHAQAEGFGFQSGEQLLANCTTDGKQGKEACRQYISGSVDTLQLMQRLTLACMFMPQGDLTDQQATGIVVKYLETHPDELWMSGARNVIAAMAEEFPCPR
jgi:hypothetical protein